MDEMNITPFSSSRPQRLFEAVAWSESNKDTYNVTTSSTKQNPQGFHNSESNAVITPPHPPPPPFCKQQRYLQRNNIFNEATFSRFPQLSMQRAPHDVITPPHPPSLYHDDVCSIGSRLRVPGSSGNPQP